MNGQVRSGGKGMRGDQQVEAGQGDVAPTRSVDAARYRRSWGSFAGCLGKLTSLVSGVAAGSVTLIVAVAVMTLVVARVDSETDAFPVAIPVEASPLASSVSPPRCAPRYTAVLDLAELERNYGKASGAYRHAFGDVSGKMMDCRGGERYATASSEAGMTSARKPGLT